jgi:hypothetical protein
VRGERFLNGAWRFFNEALPIPTMLQDAILLLNAALINPEPLAQLVLALSAVEMMGQDEKWSRAQQTLLKQLATAARKNEITTTSEGNEVAQAVERGMHRIGLRQGVFRILNRLGMPELKDEWDNVYGYRSKIVHGLDSGDRHQLSEYAQRAVTLCGQVIFKSVGTKNPETDAWLCEFYPLPQ